MYQITGMSGDSAVQSDKFCSLIYLREIVLDHSEQRCVLRKVFARSKS